MRIEGNSVRDYKIIPFLIGLFVGIPFLVGSLVIRLLTTSQGDRMPGRAPRIVVGFHQDFPVFMGTTFFWKYLAKVKAGWVGSHTFASYFASLELMFKNIHAIRYDRRKVGDVYTQVLEGIKNFDGDVVIRTDSGRPYNVVRKSAIRFAIDSGRGLVGFRQKTNRYIRIYGHYFPLPLSHATTTWTRNFSHAELQTQSIEYWRDQVQQEMDSL